MKKFFIFLLLVLAPSSMLVGQEPPSSQTEERFVSPPPAPQSSDYAFPLEDILPPKTDQEGRFFKEFVNMLSVLGIILGLILIAAWVLRKVMNTRVQQMNVSSQIKVLESRSLSPKTAVHLIEIQGKGIAFAESANGVTLLTEISPLTEADAESTTSRSAFNRLLEEKSRQQEDLNR